MESKDYIQKSLENNISVNECLWLECDKLLSYHSYSPQFSFYKEHLINAMDSCLYKDYITKEDHEFLMRRLKKHKDTNALNLVAPILHLLGRFKPRLKLIDLLYDIDLERTYILKLASKEMNEAFHTVNNFGDLYYRRQEIILEHLTKAYEEVDSPSRKCYYHLSLAKNALIVFTKYYRDGSADELMNLYLDIATQAYQVDKDFYDEYYKSFVNSKDNSDDSCLSDSNLFSGNNTNPSMYSYFDFLNDYNIVFKSLSSSKEIPKVDFYTKKVLNSSMPELLRDRCVKALSELEICYTLERFDISNCFVWYDVVGKDFIYYLTLKNFSESSVVVNTFDNLLTEENLVEFYVNKALMSSLPDEGDELTYNVALIDSLENLQSYNFISDVSYYFNKYRR